MKEQDISGLLRDMFASQKVAVLGTSAEGQPYGSLVAFAATGDLERLLFATARSTRKYANLLNDPRVALVVDNRGDLSSGLSNALAVSAMGKAEELRGDEKEQMVEVYLARHPYLADFTGSHEVALFAVRVEYYVVSSFDQGVRLEMPLR
jgi:nitroimidazol reductase NimA-like FMN-containing flavoprotein (pyridoxamine 5'-phosphate oxidase superfamily)